jgi:NADH-quinone oxidoreductase subunit F
MSEYETQLLVCSRGTDTFLGSESLVEGLRREINEAGLNRSARVIVSGCDGACNGHCPSVLVYPHGMLYQKVGVEDATDIVKQQLVEGRPVDRLRGQQLSAEAAAERIASSPFFAGQQRIAMRNYGEIDPGSLDAYLAARGYEAARRALTAMTPEQVVGEVTNSELRGRGGAGFPTGLKWSIAAAETSPHKYVVCNADEGDPGAFMDRSILEGDPHAVLEGMVIAGYAIGAHQGYIYVRAEYPIAIDHLAIAIEQARERGILGTGLFGSDFDFDCEIRIGAGAFVCGEETALIHSIEGLRGNPRCKPPFPAAQGLFGKPTIINNVETLANVPYIILNGASSFQQHGAGKSRGTKVFALAGNINNAGLVEVPMGITLGSIVYDIGGGIPGDRDFKAAQIGGPSGGCIPKTHLNTPLTYESLPELGAIMGSGGLIILNEDTCMVDLARFFLDFIQDESCGKCTPCRLGTKVMLEIVTRICEGKAQMEDLDRLEELAAHIGTSSLCGLGHSAPNPVLSTLRHFREEYVEHIRDGHCRAGRCSTLVHSPCVNACPASVNVPAYLTYVKQGKIEQALRVHLRNNPFPATCGRVCPQWCIDKCRRSDLEGPLAVRAVKRFMADQRDSYVDLYPEKAEPNGRKVAIVGSGPAGLTCAYYLVLLGYEVTVFESKPEAGGMMRYAIPDYRLPREVLAREIRDLERLGVEIRTGVTVGQDVTLDELKQQGYEAYFVATGTGAEVLPSSTPGIDLPGVISGIRFLEDAAVHRPMKVGRDVLVVGGGDAAVDCSRVAMRLGAERVTVAYRRTRREMPTSPIEIREAEVEGVTLEVLTRLVEIRRAPSGRLTAKLQRLELGEFDSSGRRRPVPIEEAVRDQEFDSVIIAIGQTSDLAGVFEGTELEEHGRDLEADLRTGATSAPDLFAGGDVVTGPATVIEAIAAGQRAARSIDQLFDPGDCEYFWERLVPPEGDVEPEGGPDGMPPTEYPLLSPEERLVSVEVEKTISCDAAKRESCRCLRCDYK